MSSAKRVVDSTIRKILKYTSEILISIIILIILSLPLVFAVPMWIQEVVFDVPSSNLIVNPLAWFGAFVTLSITIGLGILSFIFGYLFFYRIIPETKSKEVPVQETEESDEFETENSKELYEDQEPKEPIEEETSTNDESVDS